MELTSTEKRLLRIVDAVSRPIGSLTVFYVFGGICAVVLMFVLGIFPSPLNWTSGVFAVTVLVVGSAPIVVPTVL